ncbi:MAG: hypothetical protein E4H20_08040, partial [Spirochaetales bacterium]
EARLVLIRSRGGSKLDHGGSNDGQAESNQGNASLQDLDYDTGIQFLNGRNDMSTLDYTVEVKELPELNVACARHVGPYSEVGEAFGRLYRWAGPRGLIGEKTRHLATYLDDPDITPADKLRSSACMTVPEGTPADGDIGLMKIPGGAFAVGHFEIEAAQFGEAWNALMGEWLPASGYQPDDRPCYELYLNDHEKHPQKKFIVDICQPVKPL